MPDTSTTTRPPASGTQPPPSPLRTANLHLRTARRLVRQYGFHPGRVRGELNDSPVFVVGSPRSGTSFIAGVLGRLPGYADLGEVNLLKAWIPHLHLLPDATAAPRIAGIMHQTQRLGLVAGLRPVEQTPESTYLIGGIAAAFPRARFLYMVRDGRDVASSLVGLGWLRGSGDAGADDAGNAFGGHARFWVEPERREEFATVSEARRAAWVWRRYNEAVQAQRNALPGDALLEVRYEQMVADPDAQAARIAGFLGQPELAGTLAGELGTVYAKAIGRWRSDLDERQQADVLAEAGDLLAALGYR